jgi:transcriptional regulator with XRE-family HTH domain
MPYDGIPQQFFPVLQAITDRRSSDIAAAAGISRAKASELLNFRRVASPRVLARLEAAMLGCDAEDLARSRARVAAARGKSPDTGGLLD